MNIFIIANDRTGTNDNDSILENKAVRLYKDGDKIFRLKKYQTSKYQKILKDKPCTRIINDGSLFWDFELKKLRTNELWNAKANKLTGLPSPADKKWRQYFTNRKGWQYESKNVGLCGLGLDKWSNDNKIDISNLYPRMNINSKELKNEGLMNKYHYSNILIEKDGRVRLAEDVIGRDGLMYKQYLRQDGLYGSSFGTMVAFYCSKNLDSHIYLVGFSFGKTGIPCLRHDWKSEKDWCNSQKNITII